MKLFRELELTSSTLLVIGNIVGVGIFTTSGLVLEDVGQSPWVLGVWLLGGLLALSGAICYSVLGRAMPQAGGEYAFLSAGMGSLPAFLAGWASLLIGFSAPIAAGALGLAQYLQVYLPATFGSNVAGVKLVAAVTLVAATLLLSKGLRFGARLHSWITGLNLVILAGFIIFVLQRIDSERHLPSLLEASPSQVDVSGLGASIILVLFAYSGWNAATYVGEEVRRPDRNIPASLVLGTLVVIALYLLVNLAYFAAVPGELLRGKVPVAQIVAHHVFGPVGSGLISLLIGSSILSSITAMSIAGPRVYFAMSRDGLFPAWLREVDPKRKVPFRAIFFQAGIALVLVILTDFRDLLLFSGAIMILFTTLTVATIFRLARPMTRFSWFFYRVLPGLFVFANTVILINAVTSFFSASLKGAVVLLTGLPIYLYYLRHRTAEPAGND